MEKIIEIIDEVKKNLPNWQAMNVKKRLKYFRALNKVIEKKTDIIIATVHDEIKKAPQEVLISEIATIYRMIKWYSKNAKKILEPEKVDSCFWFNKKIEIHKEPIGLVLVMSPWNYPFSLPMGAILPALIAGNAVIFRPSRTTIKTGLLIKQLFDEAGFPPIFTVITGDRKIANFLIHSPLIDKIHFTGSQETGEMIYQENSKIRMLPPGLELGGSNPALVLADADLKQAAKTIIWGRFSNAGQTCNAIKRLIVVKEIADEFLEILRSELLKLKQFNQEEKYDYDVAPLATQEQWQTVMEQIDEAWKKGAYSLTKFETDVKHCWISPTILVGVKPEMKIWQKEVFGPVLPVMIAENEEEAIRLANDSVFGLGASVFTSKKNFQKIAKKIQAGSVNHNDALTEFAIIEAPFAGWKKSGLGAVHGKESLLEFVREKVVITEKFNQVKFWQFPYSVKKFNLLRKIIFPILKLLG
jgi:succinate-semialdehyde dehydrogenase/glutarate-semialdehyde dehydrogenase